MMEKLFEKRLENGEFLEIFHWDSSMDAPCGLVRYLMSSIGYDTYRKNLLTQAYWRVYYREALAGNASEEITDHLFLAKINGVYAARIWFAYSKRSLRGNFGNVFTEPEYRRRGIMKELMPWVLTFFRKSPAKLLCCSTGNRFAAATYRQFGFEMIYGGSVGPMAILKTGTFLDAAAAAYRNNAVVNVRPGTRGDQFDCDKFLFYSPDIRQTPMRHVRRGAAAFFDDYRIVFQEEISGNAKVFCAENADREIVGYAFIVRCRDENILDFTLHSAAIPQTAELIRPLQTAFQTISDKPVNFYAARKDQEKVRSLNGISGVRIVSIDD